MLLSCGQFHGRVGDGGHQGLDLGSRQETSAASLSEATQGRTVHGPPSLLALGLHDQDAIRGISYFYLNPSVARSFTLTEWAAVDLSLGYGFKAFNEDNNGMGNVHDLLLGVTLPIAIARLKPLYFKPSVNLAWTDVVDQSFSDGLVVWGGLNLGVDL